jgi:S-adenosylmethionine:tRNA ribosyltransferase-isomerase
MKTSDFDFPLPESLIAGKPLPERDSSRLLVLNRGGGIHDRRFHELGRYLRKGDILLLNDTKVLPFRLRGMKPDGRSLEMLLVRDLSDNRWEIMSRGRYTGEVTISDKVRARVHKGETAELIFTGDLRDMLRECGEMPLPPYIKRRADRTDKERYQTVYAEAEGSVAAPTAGLHFTKELLERLRDKGVLIRRLTLHVGKGTFVPIRSERLKEHLMETEHFRMDKDLIDEIRGRNGRLVAVGTTTARAIEGYFSGRYVPEGGVNGAVFGRTDTFIYPGYRFRAVDSLITNFHLPRSTPLMLVSALCGRERLLKAYGHAVGKTYRFFSYGDAMLIQ